MTHLIKQITDYLNDNEKWKWKLLAVELDFYINVMICNVIAYISVHLFDQWRMPYECQGGIIDDKYVDLADMAW